MILFHPQDVMPAKAGIQSTPTLRPIREFDVYWIIRLRG